MGIIVELVRIIGASLSKPHMDQYNGCIFSLYMYIYSDVYIRTSSPRGLGVIFQNSPESHVQQVHSYDSYIHCIAGTWNTVCMSDRDLIEHRLCLPPFVHVRTATMTLYFCS